MANIFLSSEQQGIVVFWIWKSLSYPIRMLLSIICIVAGFVMQYQQYAIFPGILLIFVGNLFLLVRGYDNRVKAGTYSASSDWERVEESKLLELQALDKEMKRWDRSVLDVSSSWGCLPFLLILAIPAVIAYNAIVVSNIPVLILCGDAIVLLLPHWVTGIRSILTQPTLLLKITLIQRVLGEAEGMLTSAQVEYFMLLKGTAETRIPEDVKFRVKFPNQDPDFLGYYGQVVVNNVSGNKYPYFYVVLVAKQGYGLKDIFEQYHPSGNLTKEYKEQGDVEVLVIRQTTTRTSGYHTKDKVVLQTFVEGLTLVEKVTVRSS